jgi:nucleoporin NUP82
MMANGDIYTLCPVMPLRTTIALSKLQRLKAYLSLQGSVEEQKWLEELVKQVPQTEGPSTPSRSILSRSTAKKAKEETDAPDRNVRLHPPHLTEEGGPAPGSHKLPVRQGPARMDPAPEEAVDEIAATDLVLLSVDHSGEVAMTGDAGANESATSTKAGEGEDGVLVLAMVWSNGRVDVGLQVDGIRGSWTGQVRPD